MATKYVIQSILDTCAVAGIILMLLNEDRLIAFEEKIKDRFLSYIRKDKEDLYEKH